MSKHPIDILRERGVVDKMAGDMKPEDVDAAVELAREMSNPWIEAFEALRKNLRDPKVAKELGNHFGTTPHMTEGLTAEEIASREVIRDKETEEAEEEGEKEWEEEDG
jgi:hypothetical protein